VFGVTLSAAVLFVTAGPLLTHIEEGLVSRPSRRGVMPGAEGSTGTGLLRYKMKLHKPSCLHLRLHAGTMRVGLLPAQLMTMAEPSRPHQRVTLRRLGSDCASGDPIAMPKCWAGRPSTGAFREHAEAGGLMSYGTDLRENFRHVAVYVDKVFRRAKVAELPIQEPTKFELVINLKVARALGVAVPASLLARADDVIE
jgi:hypothetical protein